MRLTKSGLTRRKLFPTFRLFTKNFPTIFNRFLLLKSKILNLKSPPACVGIIMDGNRRWALSRGLEVEDGWRAGYHVCRTLALACLNRGITNIFAFGFSTDNWKRPLRQVQFLFRLLEDALITDHALYVKNDVRVRIIGHREGLPASLRSAIDRIENATSGHRRGTLTLCVNYSGREEIRTAVREVVARCVSPDDVTIDMLQTHMWSGFVESVPLMIRSSGVHRMSGFLTWATAYAEFYVTEKLWPELTVADLDVPIEWYHRQEKRHGT